MICSSFDSDAQPDPSAVQIQGSLLLSALVPMLIGCTGLVGMLTKFIGPITVSPLILLLMASSVDMCVFRMEKHWVSLM